MTNTHTYKKIGQKDEQSILIPPLKKKKMKEFGHVRIPSGIILADLELASKYAPSPRYRVRVKEKRNNREFKDEKKTRTKKGSKTKRKFRKKKTHSWPAHSKTNKKLDNKEHQVYQRKSQKKNTKNEYIKIYIYIH